jgi:hypothetical protein
LIFVTGCARSGTSLTTKLLKAHGCRLGEVNVLYENTGVRQNVLKPYLRSIGADPLGQKALPDTNMLKPVPGLRKQVAKFLNEPEPWAYKDAKLALVWPVWAEAFPEAKWVLVRRDKERIIDSCIRTDFMHSFKERHAWGVWVDEHLKRFAGMVAALDLIEFWPDQVVHNAHTWEPVCEFLGLPFNLTATREAVDYKLWHKAEQTTHQPSPTG